MPLRFSGKGVRAVLLAAGCLGLGAVDSVPAKETSRQFSYRGRETIAIRMVGGVPGGVSSGGVEVQVAGVMAQGKDLSFNFGLASERKPVGVVIEDATAATAIRLVEQFPAQGLEMGEDGRWIWFGQGGKTVIEPKTVPWVLREGESSFVFRIFVELEGGGRVEIYQPAVFGEDFKSQLRTKMGEAGVDTGGGEKKEGDGEAKTP